MSENPSARSVESLRHEYELVQLNLHHYSNLRFIIFAISFVVIGVVAHVAFGKGEFDEGAVRVARIGGFLMVAMFWLYQERMTLWWAYYQKIAMDLEGRLGYSPSSTAGESLSFLPAVTLLTRMFYFLIFVFWAYAFGMTP